jgi:hypothetical protein
MYRSAGQLVINGKNHIQTIGQELAIGFQQCSFCPVQPQGRPNHHGSREPSDCSFGLTTTGTIQASDAFVASLSPTRQWVMAQGLRRPAP